MTSNGKIDRAALPNPLSIVQTPEIEGPTDIETMVISAWQQVLQHEQIGPLTNFFDVGGHSLKALTLVDVLQTRFGFAIEVADVFELPTPRQQATLCSLAATQTAPSTDDLAALLDDLGIEALEALLADVSDKQRGS